MTLFIAHFGTARDYTLQVAITYTFESTVTSLLPLIGSGFQWLTFPFFWVQNCSRPQLPASNSNSSHGRSVKLQLAFASTIIPVFSRIENHDQDFYSHLHVYMCQNGEVSSTKVGLIFLCRRYICCTIVSARVYKRCYGV
jgi:hypothetical protein